MAVRGDAKVTTDHEFIRDWIERRGGSPAALPRASGSLRIDFGTTRPRRTPIGWDEFFDWFERNQLAFQYGDGDVSARLIDRASVVKPPSRRRRR